MKRINSRNLWKTDINKMSDEEIINFLKTILL